MISELAKEAVFRLGIGRVALALLAGVLCVQWLPTLPPRWLDLSVGVAAICLGWRFPSMRLPAVFLIGAALASWHGEGEMRARLPREWEGRDFFVTGVVDELPRGGSEAASFVMKIEKAAAEGADLGLADIPLRGRIRVSWYRADGVPEVCSRWRLKLRLKRPRGLINPGGTDTERSALERGIVATGYVREDAGNGPVGAGEFCVDGVRDAISRQIALRLPDPHDARLLQALSVGDTRGLDRDDWEVARANGISHLIAISGFHVGIAAIFGVWLCGGVWRCLPALALRLPRTSAQALAAFGWAAVYSALAGFGLPTVRTLLMIAIVAMARCTRRAVGGAQSLALALIAILAVDPLAVLSAGFWLSFVGVAFLMLSLSIGGQGWRGFIRELTQAQWLMTVSLLPLTLWFFGRASLVGALSNLVAAPFVSFIVVPLTLLGTLLLALMPPWATPVYRLAGWAMHGQWWLLERMAVWPGAHWYLPAVTPAALVLATTGALWLFLPRGMPARLPGLLLFVPLLFPPRLLPAPGGFQVWVLDVGQGLSVLLRTRNHALLYDTGARFPSGFDLGEAVVLPSMRALGVDSLDILMLSHADNDHAGGAESVAAAFPQAQRYSGEPGRLSLSAQPCEEGQRWEWDEVRFQVVHPSDSPASTRSNDRSCVLLVEGRGGQLILTGDIGSRVEPAVATALGTRAGSVLLVPHHGSRSSSSTDFIASLGPSLAVVSAGWRSRFGHPHPLVLQRYLDAGVPVLNTADSGALAIEFPAADPPRVAARWRQRQRRYWRE
jgi:competence protein ComEC